jgi:hypothetical protein
MANSHALPLSLAGKENHVRKHKKTNTTAQNIFIVYPYTMCIYYSFDISFSFNVWHRALAYLERKLRPQITY